MTKGIIAGVLTAVAVMFLAPSAVLPECLDCKSCSELLHQAEKYQQDLRTVDLVLGSALDSGSMDKVRSYKLRRGSVKMELDRVMKAISLKGCVLTRNLQ